MTPSPPAAVSTPPTPSGPAAGFCTEWPVWLDSLLPMSAEEADRMVTQYAADECAAAQTEDLNP